MSEINDYGSMVSVGIDPARKEEILKEEREKAFEMVKTASFRSNMQDPYPSPFLNLSDTKIPETSQEIFKWCKYFYMFDPLISGSVNALSAFPVTEVYLEDMEIDDNKRNGKSETLKTYERVFYKNINIHKLLIEIGIDYHLYGNCFVFGEMRTSKITGQKEWKNMVRLDPSKMTIDYNPATQEKVYKWEIPQNIARIVRNKKPKAEYDKIPDIIKKAVVDKKTVILNPKNIYHFSRATDSMGESNIWGTPVIANVLKLLMYRNILRQAQEAIAREHIVPMRIYYLQKTDSYNMEADWNKVAQDFAAELSKTVRDPNYKVVSPVPVNMLSVGGQGRALLLTPEIQQIQEEILAGMNVPREFLFGGVSYSGSSISLKILENQFITYRLLQKDFMQEFVIKGMAKARGEWINEKDDEKLISAKMTDLKMQDDVQQKQLIIQLNGAGKCSNEYMWKTIGIDPEKMKAALEKEALEAVELQSKIRIKQMQAQLTEMDMQFQLQQKQAGFESQMQQKQLQEQAMLQQQMQPQIENQPQVDNQQAIAQQAQGDQQPQVQDQQIKPEDNPNDPANQIDPSVKQFALQILSLPEAYRETPISKLSPQKQVEVKKALQILDASEKAKKNSKIDMRPMPEKLPPRRNSLK